MVAAVSERARRRKKDLLMAGITIEDEEIMKEIEERDRKDSTREVSPLRMASDAIKLDTSELTVEDQVAFIVARAQKVIAAGEKE
jgi:cytidylate kinase